MEEKRTRWGEKTTKGIYHIDGSSYPGLYNKRIHDTPKNAVYIGRPSKWGNPFVIGEHGTRAEVIQKYEDYLLGSPELMSCIVQELRGKHLVCYCAPHACHGQVLMKHANCVFDDGKWVLSVEKDLRDLGVWNPAMEIVIPRPVEFINIPVTLTVTPRDDS